MVLLLLLTLLFTPKSAFAQYAPTLGPTSAEPTPTVTLAPSPTPEVTLEPSLTPTPTLSPSPTLTPTPTINPAFELSQKYLNDYLYQRDLYTAAYTEYQTAKKVDTKYSTLDTRQQKHNAAKVAIIARGKMIKAYLALVRVSLDKYKDSNYDQTQKFQDQLLSMEKWIDSQQPVVEAMVEPQDLAQWAKDFKKQYDSIQVSMYSSLVLSEINQSIYLKNQIKDFAHEYKNPDSQVFVDEIDRQVSQVQLSLDKAFTSTKQNPSEGRISNIYLSAKSNLGSAKSTLANMLNDLKYIISRFSNE